MARPPLTWSRAANWLATTAGWRYVPPSTMEPSRARVVSGAERAEQRHRLEHPLVGDRVVVGVTHEVVAQVDRVGPELVGRQRELAQLRPGPAVVEDHADVHGGHPDRAQRLPDDASVSADRCDHGVDQLVGRMADVAEDELVAHVPERRHGGGSVGEVVDEEPGGPPDRGRIAAGRRRSARRAPRSWPRTTPACPRCATRRRTSRRCAASAARRRPPPAPAAAPAAVPAGWARRGAGRTGRRTWSAARAAATPRRARSPRTGPIGPGRTAGRCRTPRAR